MTGTSMSKAFGSRWRSLLLARPAVEQTIVFCRLLHSRRSRIGQTTQADGLPHSATPVCGAALGMIQNG